ncbi:hypothetical protein LC085_06040 [Bacillus tianshenii]|uniref:hypothetical protein n=1 Tax=Sutcliffiella tianshenii TaxID=1463404 RepID=UPI001CD66D69|nr:hypothetical protein [Bacillus tianshenii]MCA1319468.1 hypothetical protein [Bacillus tianshenii]
MKLTKYMIIIAIFIASITFHLTSHPSSNTILSLVKDSFFLDQDSMNSDESSDKHYTGLHAEPFALKRYLSLAIIVKGADEQLPSILQHLVTVFHQGNYKGHLMKDLTF